MNHLNSKMLKNCWHIIKRSFSSKPVQKVNIYLNAQSNVLDFFEKVLALNDLFENINYTNMQSWKLFLSKFLIGAKNNHK